MQPNSNQGRLLWGRVFSIIGLIFAVIGAFYVSVVLNVLGIILGMFGYVLGSRTLGVVACVLSFITIFVGVFFGQPASQV
jgi:hypothetical protein